MRCFSLIFLFLEKKKRGEKKTYEVGARAKGSTNARLEERGQVGLGGVAGGVAERDLATEAAGGRGRVRGGARELDVKVGEGEGGARRGNAGSSLKYSDTIINGLVRDGKTRHKKSKKNRRGKKKKGKTKTKKGEQTYRGSRTSTTWGSSSPSWSRRSRAGRFAPRRRRRGRQRRRQRRRPSFSGELSAGKKTRARQSEISECCFSFVFSLSHDKNGDLVRTCFSSRAGKQRAKGPKSQGAEEPRSQRNRSVLGSHQFEKNCIGATIMQYMAQHAREFPGEFPQHTH